MWRGFTVPTCAWKIKRSTVEAREETNERKKRKEKRKKQRSEEGKEAVEPFATLSIGVVGVVAESRVTARDSKLDARQPLAVCTIWDPARESSGG